MKKKLMILLILLLNIFIIYPILRPNKNKEVGAIIGRISIVPKYSWDIRLYLKNNKTGSDYLIIPRKNNYYFLLNLEPGSYSLYKFGLSRSTTNYYYYANDLQLTKGGINIIIDPNKIVPINYLEIKVGYDKYVVYKDNIDTNEYLSDLKTYFEGLDKRGFWKDFEWGELKTGNDLITENK